MYIRVKHNKLSNRTIIINIQTRLISLNRTLRKYITDLNNLK